MTVSSPTPLSKVRFADPRAVISNAIKAFLPPEQIDVADYAALHRYLDNRGGGYVGRWSHDEAPYLVGPMRALSSRNHLTTAVVGPARSGKTAIGQNWMCQSIDADPADMLVYSATDAMIEEYVKAEINPLIDSHKRLKDKQGKLPRDNSMHFKKFTGMWVQFLAASYRNLIQKSAPRIIITELDACDGNAYELASVRRQSFMYESMVLAESHPDMAAGANPDKWTAGVMSLYRDSDRHIWYWPCPNCNAYSSPNPMGQRVMTLDWPADTPLDEIKEAARLVCPCCGSLIEDKWRRAMNRDGVWVGAGQTISKSGDISGELVAKEIAGFWITGAMSPFVIGGIGSLAYEMEKARRAVENGEEEAVQKLKDVTVKRWGLPFEPPKSVGSIDANVIADRAEQSLTLGTVPPDVRFLTGSVDVQARHFEGFVRGWGKDGESWVIDYFKMPADPATSPDDWDALLVRLYAHVYPLADNPRKGMKILAAGYDSGGQDGVTLQAYDAWRRARKRGHVRFLGKVDGRDAWTLLPLKGASGINAPSLLVTYPETQRKDRFAAARGDVPLGIFNPNTAKDVVALQLQKAETGPLYVHFPAALRAGEAPHPFFDQLVAENRLANGRWEKPTSSTRNEALDLMVMTNVMANLHGLRRLDWTSPPSWAAPHDSNVLVVDMPTPVQQLAESLKSVTQAVTPAPAPPPQPAESMAERMKRLAQQFGSGKF
ncbi:terminase gpA endonuclease subunit [Komagataeibacter oboediens]|uniref:Phage terminase large subunit family protein n=1 Tax=Komagataeibacter oboediens TaxID=65958 RepID=A0ABS5SSF2_9PROT|nr:terminase gpA endonuclease subunit [Komagataeibacter oboediens]MBL7233370.1 phage terminase large subunit family protein [Komagataeibacter oboediens]MBT0676672.1 phage terminase large subunit family protein [Komagataeibacter oboediens]MBT0678197.1 phage terminase large subunit family protein [Komagataeibacter oboediens]